VIRIRIERRRIPTVEGERLRRDPRAERMGSAPPAVPQAETIAPSGRIRRDPRAPRAALRKEAQPAARVSDLPRVVIDDPAFYVLAVPDLEDGRLSSLDRDLLGAARLLADAGRGAVVLLAPQSARQSAREDFAAAGADRLLSVTLPPGYAPEAKAAAVWDAIAALQPRHVLFPDTAAEGGDLGRRIAVALGERPAARVVKLTAQEAVSRGNGGQSDFVGPVARVLLLAPEAADPPSGARWEARASPSVEPRVAPRWIGDGGLAATDPNAVPLAEADFIVSAGNGVTDWPAFHNVAGALGAAEGASRVVCDAGLLPRARQVGASGTLVEPRCYLAFGIAGAPQHLQGIARCERVVAVNTDLHADMVKRADLAIIADAQAVMPALTRLARERRGGR
jgi:electron transfer flavoprotein alpha subunit